jgi:hypothetical protein
MWDNVDIKGNAFVAGNVGIGTTAPGSKFHMIANYGDSDLSANRVGFRYETYFNPTVSASTFAGGGGALLQINTPTGVTITSNDNHFSAFIPIVRKFGPGTVTQMIAVGGAWHWVNEGNINNFYNFFGGPVRQNGGTGTVTNAYGLYLAGLKQPFVTNAYGVYQAGSSDINYFAGNVGIGTTAPGYKLDVAGDVHGTSFPVSSDIRFKTNLERLDNVLSKLNNISAYKFDWNDLYQKLGRSDGRRHIGVIAQEIEKEFPELVSEWEQDGVKYKAVDYSRLTAVLLEAIKEQQKEIEELKEKVLKISN